MCFKHQYFKVYHREKTTQGNKFTINVNEIDKDYAYKNTIYIYACLERVNYGNEMK